MHKLTPTLVSAPQHYNLFGNEYLTLREEPPFWEYAFMYDNPTVSPSPFYSLHPPLKL